MIYYADFFEGMGDTYITSSSQREREGLVTFEQSYTIQCVCT